MDSEQVPADVEVAEGCAANHVDNAGAVDSAGTSYTEEEKILLDIAQTSIANETWPGLRTIIKRQIEKNVVRADGASSPVDVIRNPEKLEDYLARIEQALDALDEAPFTIQRLAELLTTAKNTYPSVFKYLRALEKCLWAVSPQSRTLFPDPDGVDMEVIPNGGSRRGSHSGRYINMNDPDLEPATDNFPIETRMPGAPGSGVFDHNGLDAARALETEAESRIASEVVVPEVAMLSDAPAPDPDVDLLETSPTAPTAPTAQNGVDQHLPPVSDDGDMDLT